MADTPHDDNNLFARSHTATIATCAVVLLLIACYRQYLPWMLERWWNDEYYGHGLLLPVVSGFIIYQRWESIKSMPKSQDNRGLILVAGGLCVHIAAVFLDVHFPSGFAFLTTAFGLVIWLAGWSVGQALAFPIWYLVLAIPLGRILVDQFAQPLQLASATTAARTAAYLHLPVVREGTAIHLPNYTFEVAVAWSGLKSTIAMSALAVLYAFMVRASFWKKAIIVAASGPVALAANSSRIVLTLSLGRIFGTSVAEGFFHQISGIFVFLVAIIGFFVLGALLGCNRMRDDI